MDEMAILFDCTLLQNTDKIVSQNHLIFLKTAMECEPLFRSIFREFTGPRLDLGSSSAYIHRVPKHLREGNELLYEPRIISIGPIHATSSRLFQGNDIKVTYFRDFCSRCFGEGMTELEPIIRCLEEIEEFVRPCYGDIDKNIGSDEFVKMILIDSCFILELLWRKQQGNYMYKKEDPVFHSSGMVKIVIRDLFLFENQLPYFLLDFLFVHLKLMNCFELPTLYSYIDSLVQMVTGIRASVPPNITTNTKHILEFAWYFVLNPYNCGIVVKENYPDKALRCAKSVSELKQYGMKLHCETNEHGHFLHAKIRNGNLEMGIIELDESKCCLFWNILVFEQLAATTRESVFQSFILFMNSLIKAENDVNLLCSSGIIINGMNDSCQVVSLFSRLAQKVNREDILCFCYHDFFMDMDTYCKSPIPMFRAYLMNNYYGARWDVLNALLLFILTFTQTFFSVISYKK